MPMERWTAAAAAAVAVAAAVVLVLHRPRAHKTIPGPAGLPLLGNTLAVMQAGDQAHRLFRDMDAQHGPVWALSVGNFGLMVFIRDPELARTVITNANDFVRGDSNQQAMR
jgi:hypothetical protein